MKFKIGDLVLYRSHFDKTGKVIGCEGIIKKSKVINGLGITPNLNLYLVELEYKGEEWINERYLVKA